MARTLLSGTRIRDHRTAKGLRQVELAGRCGISPSYLNLIEHNRRRIGGALLLKIAEALETDPSILSEGAEAALATALDAAAEAHDRTGAERDRLEELVSRFPGWARLIEAQYRDVRRLEQVVERLDDRLTHDPFLSASMHNVLTSVTGIRSASAILAGDDKVEPEWQARFHRNIYEDSQRLAAATEALVEYLDSQDSDERGGRLPQDEFERWLSARDWRIGELEQDPDRDADEILAEQEVELSGAAGDLARRHLTQYAADVRRLPLGALLGAIQPGATPEALSARLGVDLPLVFRRLAALPAEDAPDGVSHGLVGCDRSGTLTFRKPVPGFDLPRYSGACPLWPLFQALHQPMMPIRDRLGIGGREDGRFDALAVSEVSHPMGYDRPAVHTSWMLFREAPRETSDAPFSPVGTNCRICVESKCPARREASVFSELAREAL